MRRSKKRAVCLLLAAVRRYRSRSSCRPFRRGPSAPDSWAASPPCRCRPARRGRCQTEDESSETVLRRKLDKDGSELECIDMSKLQEKMQSVIGEDEYLNMQAFDTAGNGP